MRQPPQVHGPTLVAHVEQEIDAHLRSLRRKLSRAVERREPVEGLQARIRSEEELLHRMRAYRSGRRETGRPG